MERPHYVVPDRLLRDSRRNTWILVLPASEFLTGDFETDVSPPAAWDSDFAAVRQELPSRAVTAGLMERILPVVMLVWATVVWTFLFYELGHL